MLKVKVQLLISAKIAKCMLTPFSILAKNKWLYISVYYPWLQAVATENFENMILNIQTTLCFYLARVYKVCI